MAPSQNISTCLKTIVLMVAVRLLRGRAMCPSSWTGSGNRSTDYSTGFTNLTGFESGGACVDICAPPDAVVVPPGKTAIFDWDYLVMDHIYVPQMCHALAQEDGAHDPTLTNFPGAHCHHRPNAPVMSIHGLWPNYYQDYAACCQIPAPLDARTTSAWRPETIAALQSKWIDVAVNDGCDSCFTWNHEWQKHGKCFTDIPEAYFEAGLALHAAAEDGIEALGDLFLAHAGGTLTVGEVQALYSTVTGINATVIVVCDPQSNVTIDGSEVPYISEFSTCWIRKPGVSKGVPVTAADLDPVDCPDGGKGKLSEPCEERFAVMGSGLLTV